MRRAEVDEYRSDQPPYLSRLYFWQETRAALTYEEPAHFRKRHVQPAVKRDENGCADEEKGHLRCIGPLENLIGGADPFGEGGFLPALALLQGGRRFRRSLKTP